MVVNLFSWHFKTILISHSVGLLKPCFGKVWSVDQFTPKYALLYLALIHSFGGNIRWPKFSVVLIYFRPYRIKGSVTDSVIGGQTPEFVVAQQTMSKSCSPLWPKQVSTRGDYLSNGNWISQSRMNLNKIKMMSHVCTFTTALGLPHTNRSSPGVCLFSNLPIHWSCNHLIHMQENIIHFNFTFQETECWSPSFVFSEPKTTFNRTVNYYIFETRYIFVILGIKTPVFELKINVLY